jgi:predicted Zn-dependent peptidase
MDVILMESIKSILKDLDKEEGVISRFLYANLGFEIKKNKRREQLLYLGSELKVQHKKIMSRLYGVHRQKERLSYSILDLKRLAEGFQNKNMFFESDNVKNKNKFYIDEVERKIEELQKIQLSLLMKYDDLSEIEKIYHKIFKSIPRHENLNEETHLLLARPIKT